MGWAIHLHLIAAIAWIGGAFFMFVLGISLYKKSDQEAVYPRIGPIYGYFETGALLLILASGITMINNNGLITILFDTAIHNEVIDALRTKLMIVVVIIVMTVVHFVISIKTLHREKTPLEHFLSKASSMGIFILNLFVLHFAMIIRNFL
ncbi:MAG: hypothetical protein LGB54_07035 [Sulfurovum sp.]|nr:hypothetical protein [Sulfurovum sp.]MCB4752061.1 hypothetical protein [Sulfurovum sp.]MCB4752912.1 hypothetical protein [Sulfurovum sp.]MCB4759375.1 hypothetical protein [Sulfurovum sp.]MCB4772591.1 hypothetical protein [Sulfurovum sp.]